MKQLFLSGAVATLITACGPSAHERTAEAVEQLSWRFDGPVRIQESSVRNGIVCGRAEVTRTGGFETVWAFAYRDGQLYATEALSRSPDDQGERETVLRLCHQ